MIISKSSGMKNIFSAFIGAAVLSGAVSCKDENVGRRLEETEKQALSLQEKAVVVDNDITALQSKFVALKAEVQSLKEENAQLKKEITVFRSCFDVAAVDDAKADETRQDDMSSPEAVVNAYLKAQQWPDRVKYVIDQELTKPLMEKYYSQSLQLVKSEYRITGKREDGGETLVSVLIGDNEKSEYLLHKKNGRYYIDWAASIGYNPDSILTFKAVHRGPGVFRVMAGLSDYYSPELSNAAGKYWSVSLTDPKSFDSLCGYIEKDSDTGRAIFEILRDGASHKLTVEINFFNTHVGSDVVLIKKLLKKGW